MNSMRTNMEFFGQTCGINGGLYIWNLPEFQDAIHDKVLNEGMLSLFLIFFISIMILKSLNSKWKLLNFLIL